MGQIKNIKLHIVTDIKIRKMPRYEILLITRALHREPLKQVLKSACTALLQNNAILRKVQNMGATELPTPFRSHHQKHIHGHYFLMDVHAKITDLPIIKKEFGHEEGIIRHSIIRHKDQFVDGLNMKYPTIYECAHVC